MFVVPRILLIPAFVKKIGKSNKDAIDVFFKKSFRRWIGVGPLFQSKLIYELLGTDM